LDADALLAAARRPLVVGIGGGGDVVGALATAEAVRLAHGARPVVGGVTWERRPVDPLPGPRRVDEIEGGRPLAPNVLAAGPETRIRANGVLFGESRMAGFLGEETVLVDPTGGPAAVAEGLVEAAAALEADLIVLIDVGGDAIAHGDEPGLGSPLCDAILMAAGNRIHAAAREAAPPGAATATGDTAPPPVLGGVFGVGCDGELTPREVDARLGEIAAAGGLAGARGLTEPVARRLEQAVEHVPTEASAMALRAFRGLIGPTPIRGGRRTVEVTTAAAGTVYFDVATAVATAARLPGLVDSAGDIDEANELLRSSGIRTELDFERNAR
jgi:hypothetical protein